MEVQIIRAKEQQEIKEQKNLRVAAYCRVSTDMEEQESSFEAQCTHYTQYIQRHSDWVMAGIFADEGISGTSTRKREQFNRMIEECEAGMIDLVITKSISRFARNTLDCLKYIRRLKERNIAVFFEKENINTLDAKGEVLITIMASIAQQESQSISQNVRMGIQYRMQEGKGRLNTSAFLGLEKGKEPGQLVIVLEEARTVRRIFRAYLDGYSPAMICRQMEREEIMTGSGKLRWYPSTVARMLENEKYCGDLLMQKYFTVDFLTHKVMRNTGQLPQYYVKCHHEPVVPREVFRQVQREQQRRSMLRKDPSRLRYGSEDALFGRLFCGKCGRSLKRYIKPDSVDWRCRKRAYQKKTVDREFPGNCQCRIVPEEEVKQAVLDVLNRLPAHRSELTDRLSMLHLDDVGEARESVQIRTLLELIDRIEGRERKRDEEAACEDYEDFFQRTAWRIPEGTQDEKGLLIVFDETLVVHYLDKVTVWDWGYEIGMQGGVFDKWKLSKND